MANYALIRVEFDGIPNTSALYIKIHSEMAKIKAARQITGSDGKSYKLPDGTYFMESTQSAIEIRMQVAAVLCKIHSKIHIVVAKTDEISFAL